MTRPDVRDIRLLIAAGGVFALCWIGVVAAGGVVPAEEPVFGFINGWGDWLEGPSWPIMQFGSLAAVAVCAGTALLLRRPAAALALVSAGVSAWAVVKIVKSLVDRGRPQEFFPEASLRPAWEGPGFPSGHAAVAFAIVAASVWMVPPRWRPLLWLWAAAVGILRIYVGAHLPLDVIGGAALGLMAGWTARAVFLRKGERSEDPSPSGWDAGGDAPTGG